MHTSECVSRIFRNKNICTGSNLDALDFQILGRKGEVGLPGKRGDERAQDLS